MQIDFVGYFREKEALGYCTRLVNVLRGCMKLKLLYFEMNVPSAYGLIFAANNKIEFAAEVKSIEQCFRLRRTRVRMLVIDVFE